HRTGQVAGGLDGIKLPTVGNDAVPTRARVCHPYPRSGLTFDLAFQHLDIRPVGRHRAADSAVGLQSEVELPAVGLEAHVPGMSGHALGLRMNGLVVEDPECRCCRERVCRYTTDECRTQCAPRQSSQDSLSPQLFNVCGIVVEIAADREKAC